MRQVGPEGGKRRRVVLTKRRSKRVHLTLAAPDRRLVGPGKDLDPLDEGGVTRDRSVVVPVGAYEIGEHLRISDVDFARETAWRSLQRDEAKGLIAKTSQPAATSAVTTRPRSISIPTQPPRRLVRVC